MEMTSAGLVLIDSFVFFSLLSFPFVMANTENSTGEGRPLHVSWSILYSKTADNQKSVPANMYLAVNVMDSEHGIFQALVSIMQDESPIETFFLYDRGRATSQDLDFILKYDTITITRDRTFFLVIFPSNNEASECYDTLKGIMKGDLEYFFRKNTGADSFAMEEEVVLGEITADQILEILQDPSFPKLLKQVESLMAKNHSILEKFQ